MNAIEQLKEKFQEIYRDFLILQADIADAEDEFKKRFEKLQEETKEYIDRLDAINKS